MLWKDMAVLIKPTGGRNRNGYCLPGEQRREVFVDSQSARRTEFYTARSAGVDITLVLLVRGADYEGERELEFDGKLYRVERHYSKGGEIVELNCTSLQEKGADHEPERAADIRA